MDEPSNGAAPAEMAEAVVGKQARQQIATFVEENIRDLIQRLWDLTKAVKTVWVSCPVCKKRSEVEVTDTNSAVRAIEAPIVQGYGRSQPAAAAEGTIILRRIIVTPEAQKEIQPASPKGLRPAELTRRLPL